jgi:hypothetical protein
VRFDILAVRSGRDTDPTMYPVVGRADRGPIELDHMDGPHVVRVLASGLTVSVVSGRGLRTIAAVHDLAADVFLTDARVAIGCAALRDARGWVGTNPTVLLRNLPIDRAVPPERHHACLVGHVRHPWLQAVGASRRAGNGRCLRLVMTEAAGIAPRRLALDITVADSVDHEALAREVARRAAQYRLMHDEDLDDEEVRTFEALLDARRMRAEGRRFAMWTMPTYYVARPAQASRTSPLG